MPVNNAQQNRSWLNSAVLFLCIIQPCLDVISYWMDVWRADNTVTLALRFVLLIMVIVCAWSISEHKRVYAAATLCSVLLIAGHIITCLHSFGEAYNLSWIFSDIANYFRVLQLPFFALAMITAFRQVEDREALYDVMEKAFLINFLIILLVEAISTVTGTDPHTYPNKSLGILGWFYFANSQSAILCALVPVVLVYAYRKNTMWLLVVLSVLSFAALYLFGTRLTYLGVFVIGLGLLVTVLLTREKGMKKSMAILMILCVILCGAGFKMAPFYVNQSRHQEILAEEQEDIDSLLADGRELYGDADHQYLLPAYEKYLGGLVSRFGFERIAEEYGYSEKASEVIDWRRMKLEYNENLMEDCGVGVHLFGLPLDSLTYDDYIYDVENDWHGIYYLFGWTGLIFMALFIGCFLILILLALIRDFRNVFTMRAGAAGIALLLLLVHSYFTAGVLRRPNASFYVSMVLAMVYYLINLKKEADVS